MDDVEGAEAQADDELLYNPGFKVATLKEEGLELRAYFNSNDNAEWLWGRIQAGLDIGSYGGYIFKGKYGCSGQ